MFRVSKYVVPVFVIMTFILACSLSAPSKNSQEDNQIPVTGEQTPLVVAVPTEQPPQPTAEPTAEPTATPEPTTEPSPTPIIHLVSPYATLPEDKPQVTYDQESIRNAEQKEAYAGDQFLIGRYERPFDQEMTYLPYIDIIQSNLIRNKDDEFLYSIIFLLDNPIARHLIVSMVLALNWMSTWMVVGIFSFGHSCQKAQNGQLRVCVFLRMRIQV